MNKSDAKWLFGIGLTFIIGIYEIWNFSITADLIIPLIKLTYSLFWTLAIFIAAYLILFKKENKEHAKKRI